MKRSELGEFGFWIADFGFIKDDYEKQHSPRRATW